MLTFETRSESFAKINEKTKQSDILLILKENKDGLTAKEIAEILYIRGKSYSAERNAAAPRLTELEMKGVIEVIGKKFSKITGKHVSIYKIKEQA